MKNSIDRCSNLFPISYSDILLYLPFHYNRILISRYNINIFREDIEGGNYGGMCGILIDNQVPTNWFKITLCNILLLPDFELPFVITTDASDAYYRPSLQRASSVDEHRLEKFIEFSEYSVFLIVYNNGIHKQVDNYN